ncbi:MAG: methyl-accepting chemotaxis protein [Spirochaetales bacterium]|uniref:Methyl-accepting chemotaxis protein n=1 Tax=Candidatus Thalassospirochaeta sargassi TaxID=3119039 RepID=A0AAJ1IBV9_9SPIO|nr:methyl-accepting chemotaxis protein [Spirochaetales bacterium]
MIRRTIILLSTAAFIFLSAAGLSAWQLDEPEWKVLFTSPETNVNDIKSEQAVDVILPSIQTAPEAGASVRGDGNCLWLLTELSFHSGLPEYSLLVDFNEPPGPVEFYLNGIELGRDGVTGDNYFMQSGVHSYFSLPPQLLNQGVNHIALKVFGDSENFKLQKPSIGKYDEQINDIWKLSFLNGQIFLAFGVLVAFIGLYYLSLFLFNRKEIINLHFSLANIFLSIYFAQMGLPFQTIPTLLLLVVSKFSLFLYFTFLTLFFVRFFNVFNRLWVRTIIMVTAVLIGILYLFNSGSYSEVMRAFNTALIPGGIELLLMLFISAYSMLKKNTDAIPVFIGVATGLGAAVYDFYFAFAGIEPAFWLQGFGILIFNICMFEMLSIRAIRADKQLKASSRKISKNSRVMAELLEKIEIISLSVADMSSNLDREIEASAEGVEELVNGTASISLSAGEQLDDVKKTGESLEVLLSSSEQINQELTRQQKDVEETSFLITEMLDNISEITDSLKKTSDFTEELGSLTVKGESAVKKSAETVNAIHEDSKNIYQILSSITDISEQTNLLAMNAAIEAAHAGKAGAGFAVVAGEIRKLATNTAGRTRETVEQIDSIVSRIKDAYEANLEVKDLLSHIGRNTKTAVEQVKSVYLSIEEQRTAGRSVLTTVESLKDASSGIRTQTEKQRSKSRDMEDKQENLRNISGRVYESIEKMSEANMKIKEALGKVRNISTGTSSEALRLKNILADSDSANNTGF